VNPSAVQPSTPGVKAAKVCGILAILFALTCVGFPVAFVLGIVALVQHGKARRLVKAEPGVYPPVPATGLVTGILGLVLPVLMLPFVGMASAVAIPALLAQRERAQETAVLSNLGVVRAQAEATLLAMQTKAPGQTPSPDLVIQALSTDPRVQGLRNPVLSDAPAVQRGTSGPRGTVMVYPDREEVGGVTTWSVKFRAVVKRGGQDRPLEAEVITHTQERVQGRTEDGWEVVQPPAEAPPPPDPQ